MSDIPGFLTTLDAAKRIAIELASIGRNCPYCGKRLSRDDLRSAVVADNDARDPAHPECYRHLQGQQEVEP